MALDQVNDDDGGSGLYFKDLDDHLLEVITVRYGQGASPVSPDSA